MMITLRRLTALAERVRAQSPAYSDVIAFSKALDLRIQQRGPSKLARRMKRKRELGMAGAF